MFEKYLIRAERRTMAYAEAVGWLEGMLLGTCDDVTKGRVEQVMATLNEKLKNLERDDA